jgi:hypothetical protein
VYSINDWDPDGEEGVGVGQVYVKIKRKPVGNDFYFVAEY